MNKKEKQPMLAKLPPPSTLGSAYRTKSLGFTLIELAVSLVVIGLIAGGILTGSSMIESAKIRAQISQKEQLIAAANTFKTKYDAYPGDISPTQTAQLGFFTFTGAYAGKEVLAYIASPYGDIRFGYGDNSGDIQLQSEEYAFWQHLSEAKLINGQYGGSVSAGNYLRADTSTLYLGGLPINIPLTPAAKDPFLPQSKLSHKDNHISVASNRFATKTIWFERFSSNRLIFLVTPYQAFAIDSKTDDGSPSNGKIRGDLGTFGAGISPCVTMATPNEYDLKTDPNKTDTCSINIGW